MGGVVAKRRQGDTQARGNGSMCIDKSGAHPHTKRLQHHCVVSTTDCLSRRLESQHGIILRFVVGSVQDPQQAAALDAEQQQHGDILRLPLQVGVCWQHLPVCCAGLDGSKCSAQRQGHAR